MVKLVALTMKICWGWEAESLVAAVGGEPERLWWRNWRLTEVTVDRIPRFLLLSSQELEEDLQGPYMQYKQLRWTGRMIIFFLKCLATFLSSQEEEGHLRTLCKAESVIGPGKLFLLQMFGSYSFPSRWQENLITDWNLSNKWKNCALLDIHYPLYIILFHNTSLTWFLNWFHLVYFWSARLTATFPLTRMPWSPRFPPLQLPPDHLRLDHDRWLTVGCAQYQDDIISTRSALCTCPVVYSTNTTNYDYKHTSINTITVSRCFDRTVRIQTTENIKFWRVKRALGKLSKESPPFKHVWCVLQFAAWIHGSNNYKQRKLCNHSIQRRMNCP